MKAAERGFLIGLAVLLLGAVLFIVWKVGGDEAPGQVSQRRIPAVEPVRSETTPGGVEVLVLAEGRGEPRAKGEAMDIAFTGYLAASGAVFQRGINEGWVLEDGGMIPGWIEGLKGMKRLERRRLLIPPAMGYGPTRVGSIMPNSALVFDVQWAVLDSEDLVEGSGDEARRGATITVFYKGTLEDGRIFDTNVGGEPATFALRMGSLIHGWVLGVPGMRVGGKRKLWVPWHLAYKDKRRPGRPGRATIEPYSNLVFEIELVDVK